MKVALYGLLCVLLIPFVFPTWWMVTSSLKPISDIFVFPPQLFPTHPDWSSYKQVFTLQPFAQQYWNSAWIAAVVTARHAGASRRWPAMPSRASASRAPTPCSSWC